MAQASGLVLSLPLRLQQKVTGEVRDREGGEYLDPGHRRVSLEPGHDF